MELINQLLSEAQDAAANVTAAQGKATAKSHILVLVEVFKMMVNDQTPQRFWFCGQIKRQLFC